ncbi:MAG: hypothetical protein OEZ43_09795 [Gammaproteobacteria bacterium]|nr:hypothetical protein [Gammaproteobacteria bacterium]
MTSLVRNGSKRKALFLLMSFFVISPDAVMAADPSATPQVERFKLSYRDAEMIQYIDAQEKFVKLLDSPGVLTEEVLKDIDFEVRNIAFYRFNDRQYKKFPRIFYDSIEQRLMDRFIRAKRFAVHECFECKTTRVLLKEKQFSVLRQLDSNEALNEVGKKIGVDSFVLWEAYMYKGDPMLNIRVVSAADGQVRWSKQYLSEPAYEFEWEMYSSLWGIKAIRARTSGSGSDISVSPILDIGLRTLSRSTISDKIYYGYGVEAFFNTMYRTQVDLYGLSLNARVGVEMDSMLGLEMKNYGNWLMYLSVGQAFLKNNPVLLIRGGLEIRINRRNFIEIGGVFIPTTTFSNGSALANYSDVSSLSNLGYDVTIGFRF